MTTYVYFSVEEKAKASEAVEALNAFRQTAGSNVVVVEEEKPMTVYWDDRTLGEAFRSQFMKQDILVVYDAISVARSTSQLFEVLTLATQVGVRVEFLKYDRVFNGETYSNTQDLLSLIKSIESDYVSRRTTEALARRRAAGLPLGRPKGRKNKSLKLDAHHDEIIKYLKLNISKASIAKLVGCHPQTLYDWLERKSILSPEGEILETQTES